MSYTSLKSRGLSGTISDARGMRWTFFGVAPIWAVLLFKVGMPGRIFVDRSRRIFAELLTGAFLAAAKADNLPERLPFCMKTWAWQTGF